MIGRILDKYEILEEVGQGGMSIVYRGRDTVLKRDVAIKVLHQHLAAHDEARRRFEREAQAVAKLRHDNILEIYDYSGKGSSDSYIVTEFISGRTLKEFINKHRIAYPEIAAMIVAEVARALAHAHGLGVLHRDVKPENIMVREDGRLKLMDFGIAQVVDTQRMTVTGQLLGSPAYMSPEHVDGKPLDFRTDVFSIGILLYQLATGELPFKGRNPHEILKKIAECRFIDARVVNPLVGERLGKVIARALAREPADRYQEIRELEADLGRYLAEVELGDPREELGRFFKNPVPYEQALRQRLIDALIRRGKAELGERRVSSALELFNRVLTIDPANETVLHEIDRMSRKKRAIRGLLLVGGVIAAGGLALGAKLAWPESTRVAAIADAGGAVRPADPPDAAVRVVAGPADAAVAEEPADAAPLVAEAADAAPMHNGHGADAGARVVQLRPDAAVTAPLGPVRKIRVTTNVKYSVTWSLDGQPGGVIKAGATVIEVPPGAHKLRITHPYCYDDEFDIAPDFDEPIHATLRYRPREVRFVCEGATSIAMDGRPVPPSKLANVDFGNGDEVVVQVSFLTADRGVIEKSVTVKAGKGALEVACD